MSVIVILNPEFAGTMKDDPVPNVNADPSELSKITVHEPSVISIFSAAAVPKWYVPGYMRPIVFLEPSLNNRV